MRKVLRGLWIALCGLIVLALFPFFGLPPMLLRALGMGEEAILRLEEERFLRRAEDPDDDFFDDDDEWLLWAAWGALEDD